MKANIGRPLRVAYIAIGVILLMVPFIDVGLDRWMKIAAPTVGVAAIFSGSTGW